VIINKLQLIVINQIEAENEKTTITHVTKWYCKIWKGSWNRHYKLDGPHGTVIEQESCNWHCNSICNDAASWNIKIYQISKNDVYCKSENEVDLCCDWDYKLVSIKGVEKLKSTTIYSFFTENQKLCIENWYCWLLNSPNGACEDMKLLTQYRKLPFMRKYVTNTTIHVIVVAGVTTCQSMLFLSK
jgi:hypothetical protein